MFTKSMLDYLLSTRSRPHVQRDLTPDNAVSRCVHRNQDDEHERRIARHRSALSEAAASLQQDRAFATSEGLAKAQFNHTTQEITP